MIAYKLLNRDLTTYNDTQWVVGKKKTTSGNGGLCGPGWLHAYCYPELAHFLNPIHANFPDPVLYEVEVGGRRLDDGQLKSGWTEMTLIRPSTYPPPTLEQRIRFAIRCAITVYPESSYRRWAIHWITNTDQSSAAAYAAADAAADAADAAADAAAYAAAYAASYAAYAAEAAASYAAEAAAYAASYAAARAAINLRACAIWACSNSLDLDGVV